MKQRQVVVIGGGAAGFFGAIACAEALPGLRVILLEKSDKVLQKVLVSGGGRCNVTHACFNPEELVKYYPRGERELLGPFHRFGPKDTIAWFAERGVKLKTEADGRMFPVTNKSTTIIHCLRDSAEKAGVHVMTQMDVISCQPPDEVHTKWSINCRNGDNIPADALLITTGSSPRIWDMIGTWGHEIVAPVPSLFTFHCKDSRLLDLAGVSLSDVAIQVAGTSFRSSGPFLITHWGMSGPAVLRLSAFAARKLHEFQYRFDADINFVPTQTSAAVQADLESLKATQARKSVAANPHFGMPVRLWQRLVQAAGIGPTAHWADLSKAMITTLTHQLTAARFSIQGKSTFKEEFVTAGGIRLREVDFRTFKSKLLPDLYFAGEVLDIDAVTGGFNFQAAWTGGFIAGQEIAAQIKKRQPW